MAATNMSKGERNLATPAQMPDTADNDRRPARTAWLALCGLVLGGAALVSAAVHQAAGPFTTPPPIEQVIAEKAKSAWQQALEALRGEGESSRPRPPPAKPAVDVDRVLEGAGAGLGALAIVLGLAGFARYEDRRSCAAAAILGIAAIPWTLGLGVVIAMLLVASASAMASERRRL